MPDKRRVEGVKTLVTGGTGFAGSHLVSHLLDEGARVRMLARDPDRCADFRGMGVDVVRGDVRDAAAVDRACRGVELVFHLAAAYRTAGLPDSEYREIHVGGTENVLASSLRHGIRRVVHCSTVGVHGHVESPPANEDSPFHPGDIYQRTKLEGEMKASAFGREKGLPVVVIRPTAIYGPGDMRLLKLFRIAMRRIKPILGDGRIFYHMVHVDDLAEGFLLGATREAAAGKVFIVGGSEALTLNGLVGLISEELGVPGKTLHLPVEPVRLLAKACESVCAKIHVSPPIYERRVEFFTKSRCFDIRRARELLGYAPAVGIRQGIRWTAAWYREQRLL